MVTISKEPATTERSVRTRRRERGGFPLASLALLVSVFACLLACIDFGQLRKSLTQLRANNLGSLVAAVVAAGILGSVVGLGYLFGRRPSWKQRFLAPVAGIVAAEIGLMILLAPGAMWRTVFAICILLAAVALFRLNAD